MIACPSCKSTKSWVVDKRNTVGGEIRRRRQCDDCGERYTTKEIVVRTPPSANPPHDKVKSLARRHRSEFSHA